jgi:hypothetical protein
MTCQWTSNQSRTAVLPRPYAVRGVIWYQGEANADRAYQYRRLLPALIQDWRNRWDEGNFPFLIVQLANYGQTAAQPAPSSWAELREAQSITAAKVPNTGLAVTIDIGEGLNIHPRNKQDVRHRLALVAPPQCHPAYAEGHAHQRKSPRLGNISHGHASYSRAVGLRPVWLGHREKIQGHRSGPGQHPGNVR